MGGPMVSPWAPPFPRKLRTASACAPQRRDAAPRAGPGRVNGRGRRLPMQRRAELTVTKAEGVGPYTLLRVERGDVEPGAPGQLFVLEPTVRALPKPTSGASGVSGQLGGVVDTI